MEYTPEQLVEMQKWANLGQALVSNKKTKAQAEKLVKLLSPDIETSEDLAEPLLAPMRSELADVKAQLKTITDGAAEYHKQQKFEDLRKAGYTDEGIGKVQEIMDSMNVSSPEVAAAYFEKINPVAPAKVGGVSAQNFGNDLFGLQGEQTKEKLDMLFNDPDAFIAAEVDAVSQEFRNQ